MFLEDIVILLLVFFALRFLFRVVVPIYRSVRVFREDPQTGQPVHPRRPSVTIVDPGRSSRPGTSKPQGDKNDYIDFEEVK